MAIRPEEHPNEPGSSSREDAANQLVVELFKLLPGTSGIMLALIWGLADKTPPPHAVLISIRVASIILVATIVASLVGLQFMVSALQRQGGTGSRDAAVSICFSVAWVSFIAGCIAVIWSLFIL